MKVVSNTSPIHYLILIDQIALLPSLFGEIHVPPAVITELTHTSTPERIQAWVKHPPAWLNVHPVSGQDDATLNRLHPGEKEAILLAEQLSADLIILDEKIARQVAVDRSLQVTGLIGILDLAARHKLIVITTVVEHLSETTFRISPHLLKTLIDKFRTKD